MTDVSGILTLVSFFLIAMFGILFSSDVIHKEQAIEHLVYLTGCSPSENKASIAKEAYEKSQDGFVINTPREIAEVASNRIKNMRTDETISIYCEIRNQMY